MDATDALHGTVYCEDVSYHLPTAVIRYRYREPWSVGQLVDVGVLGARGGGSLRCFSLVMRPRARSAITLRLAIYHALRRYANVQ